MIVVAARDAPAADRNRADVVCDGRTDVAVLSKAFAVPDREVGPDGRDVRRERAGSPRPGTGTSGRPRA